MKTILGFAVAGVFFTLSVSGVFAADKTKVETKVVTKVETTTSFSDVAKLKDHLTTHGKYPATKAEIMAWCEKEMPNEFTKTDKEFLNKNLPEGTYKTAADVVTALKL